MIEFNINTLVEVMEGLLKKENEEANKDESNFFEDPFEYSADSFEASITCHQKISCERYGHVEICNVKYDPAHNLFCVVSKQEKYDELGRTIANELEHCDKELVIYPPYLEGSNPDVVYVTAIKGPKSDCKELEFL